MADNSAVQELNPEEQAAVARAKADLEAAKARVGQPLPSMLDPLWLLEPEGQKVMNTSLGRDPKTGEPRAVNAERATVVIPQSFVLTLTHHHKFEFLQGVREVPACLLDHPWVAGHGVRAYAGPAPKRPEVVLGSQTMSDPVKVGDRMMPAGPFVTAAFGESGLSVADWNALGDDERDARIQAEVDKAAAAAGMLPKGKDVPPEKGAAPKGVMNKKP